MSDLPTPDPHIPAPLQRELQSAFASLSGCTGVPPETDRSILAMAQMVGIAHHRRRARTTLIRLSTAAAAALLAFSVWLIWPVPTATQPKPLAITTPEDLNRDGLIDMLDALTLARYVDTSQPGPDLNADGLLTRADVDTLALSAVSLERGSL